MALKKYGVLKGKATAVRLGTSNNAHYQVHLIDNTTDYRIAINVASALSPSELEYVVLDNFRHPLTTHWEALPLGFTKLASKPNAGALDFIRGNLFNRSLMRILPFSVPGVDNDLNEKIDRFFQRAMADEHALVYAFGERWGPEANVKDKFFAFLPGNGIHDIHMNQSNVGQFRGDDGVWQDGGLVFQFPNQQQWAAIFLKFQSQGWHTDDHTGHKIGKSDERRLANAAAAGTVVAEPFFLPTTEEPQGLIRLVAALVNGAQSPEKETVTLLNTAPQPLSLAGWQLLDADKHKYPLSGTMAPGATLQVAVRRPFVLSNQGGIITLIDENGLKVDGVAYTREQAQHPGWTISF